MIACPSELEIDQAIAVGANEELLAHLDICTSCRSLWDLTVHAIDLAHEIPVSVPSARSCEEQRTALLAAWDQASKVPTVIAPPPRVETPRVETAPRRRSRIAFALAAAAIAAGGAAWVLKREPEPVHGATAVRRGFVHPHNGAIFALVSTSPDEIVRLRDGVIDVDVDPLGPGERFRVVVGADEVEVRGTSFEVVATDDKLVSVHVVHGRVEVKRTGASMVVLTGGEAWSLPVPDPPRPASTTPAPAPIEHVPPRHTHVDKKAAPPASKKAGPQEVAFLRGWEALRKEELGEAAAAFDRAVTLEPDGALSEDAMFWRAVSLARLHRTPDAISALRSFVDAYPLSTRLGEASAMLGWLLVETHELDEARRRFQAAEHDPDASARESARRGLDALH